MSHGSDKKSREQLLAEIEALRQQLAAREAQGDKHSPGASSSPSLSRPITRREALTQWVAPVILSVPIVAALHSETARGQVPPTAPPTPSPPSPSPPTGAPTLAPTLAPTPSPPSPSPPTGAPTLAPAPAPRRRHWVRSRSRARLGRRRGPGRCVGRCRRQAAEGPRRHVRKAGPRRRRRHRVSDFGSAGPSRLGDTAETAGGLRRLPRRQRARTGAARGEAEAPTRSTSPAPSSGTCATACTRRSTCCASCAAGTTARPWACWPTSPGPCCTSMVSA